MIPPFSGISWYKALVRATTDPSTGACMFCGHDDGPCRCAGLLERHVLPKLFADVTSELFPTQDEEAEAAERAAEEEGASED